jgi:Big-like domain-containing protein
MSRREERDELRRLEHEVEEIERLLEAKSATLTIHDEKGNRLMPATIAVGKTATAALHEFAGLNSTGAELPPIGPVSYSSSDPTIATVDPTSGLITAVAAGTVTISGLDAGNKLSASDTVSDTPPPPPTAQSATLVITPN